MKDKVVWKTKIVTVKMGVDPTFVSQQLNDGWDIKGFSVTNQVQYVILTKKVSAEK